MNSLKEIKESHRKSVQKHRKSNPRWYKALMKKYRVTLAPRYALLKYVSKKRGFPTTITRKQHTALLLQPCYYCGNSLDNETGYCLDRRDNKKYYYLENVLPCCCACNRIKNKYLTVDEMKFVMTQLNLYRKGCIN